MARVSRLSTWIAVQRKILLSYEFIIVDRNFDYRDRGERVTFTDKSRVYFTFIWTELQCISSQPKYINYSNTHVFFLENCTVRHRLDTSISELVHTPISKEYIIKSWDLCSHHFQKVSMKIYSKFEKISKIEQKLQLRKKYENLSTPVSTIICTVTPNLRCLIVCLKIWHRKMTILGNLM